MNNAKVHRLGGHEYSGDPVALAAARKAGDLVCNTYLDTGKRVFDAGDSEMNMSILTAMAMLHRVTGEPRYLRMAREVEKDWERAGDYLRAGLDGREYYQSPKPRWESLHGLQGLVEMWRITGARRRGHQGQRPRSNACLRNAGLAGGGFHRGSARGGERVAGQTARPDF